AAHGQHDRHRIDARVVLHAAILALAPPAGFLELRARPAIGAEAVAAVPFEHTSRPRSVARVESDEARSGHTTVLEHAESGDRRAVEAERRRQLDRKDR